MTIQEKKKDRIINKQPVVTCDICKKDIYVESELDQVEYVVANAKTVLFFHKKCMEEQIREERWTEESAQ